MAEKKAESKKKKKKSGCLGWFLIILILVVGGGYVAVKVLFPAERIRAEIVKRASAALGRQVELDAVAISILPSPSLDMRGFRIYNPENFPGGEFVSIDHLSCGFQIMPLLRRQFIFNSLIIEHPVVRLRKTAEGRTNYAFTIKTSGLSDTTKAASQGDSLTAQEAALSPFAFDWAEIKSADVIYVDDSSEVSFTLNNFSLNTRLRLENGRQKGVSMGTLTIPTVVSNMIPNKLPLAVDLTYNAEIDFQYADLVLKNTTLKVNGIPFAVEATVRNLRNPQSVFARLKASGVSLEPLLSYLPSGGSFDKSKLRLSGTLDGQVEIRLELGSRRAPYWGGSFRFNDLTAGYANISNRVYFKSLKIDFAPDSLSFFSEGGKLSEEDFSLSGSIRDWKNLAYRLKTKGAYALVGLLPLLDQKYKHELSGRAGFDLDISGRKSNWAESILLGTLSVDKLYYNNDSLTSPLSRLDMRLRFTPQIITVDSLYAEYPGVRLSLNGSVKNGLAHLLQPRKNYKKPYLDFKLYAPLVNYDILVPPETDSAAAAAALQAAMAPAPVFIPDIEAGGQVRIDTLVARGVNITALTGEITYNNRLITYRNARGTIYSGTITGDGTVDLSDMYQPLVTGNITVKGAEANDLVSQFAGFPNRVFGKIDLSGSFNGRGSEVNDFVRSLNADGQVSMKEGKLVNFDLITSLTNQFGLKTPKEETLRDLVTLVKIQNGKLVLDGTKLFSKIGDWNVGGTVAFVDKKLDLNVGLYLSQDYSSQFNMLGGLLKDDKGRVQINFKLGGSYDSPTVSHLSTDKKAVQQKVEDAVKEKAKGLLQDLLDKK